MPLLRQVHGALGELPKAVLGVGRLLAGDGVGCVGRYGQVWVDELPEAELMGWQRS